MGGPKEDIGAGATSNHNRVLFWKGDTVVDATFSHIGPMSAGEMRELASHVPNPPGTRALMPPILANLPQGSLDAQTTHYAIGPAGYAGGGRRVAAGAGWFRPRRRSCDRKLLAQLRPGHAHHHRLPHAADGRSDGAENPRLHSRPAARPNRAWPKPLQDSDLASLEVRRSGPLVAIVSGDAIPDESHKLIEMVHYEADLTAIPQPTDSEVKKTAQLLLGIAAIVIVGGSAALLLGFFLGGGRALYRIVRGKPASSVFDEEFIRIDLREEWDETLGPLKGPHPKG